MIFLCIMRSVYIVVYVYVLIVFTCVAYIFIPKHLPLPPRLPLPLLQVTQVVGSTIEAVEILVRQSTVVEARKKGSNDTKVFLPENLLYKRGALSSTCILILAGKVEVVVGKREVIIMTL